MKQRADDDGCLSVIVVFAVLAALTVYLATSLA